MAARSLHLNGYYLSTSVAKLLISGTSEIETTISAMRTPRKLVNVLLISSLYVAPCSAQSLADAARQQQAAKKSSPSTAKHVITNEDLGSSAKSDDSSGKHAVQSVSATTVSDSPSKEGDHPSSEQIKDQVREQRKKIAELQAQIDDLKKQMEPWKTSDCTHVLNPDNSNTCDIPKKLTAAMDRTKDQLEQEKKNLDSVQEDARKMGYANSVYDPN